MRLGDGSAHRLVQYGPARAVADAVLFEGYALYPYRGSAPKNFLRWQFGVLAPRAFSESSDNGDTWWMATEFLVSSPASERANVAQLSGQIRFLQMRRRTIEARREAAQDGEAGLFEPVDQLDLGDRLLLPWDEGEVREIDFSDSLAPTESESATEAERTIDFMIPGSEESELVLSAAHSEIGRIVHRSAAIAGVLRVTVRPVEAAFPLVHVRLRVENVTPWEHRNAARDAALSASLLSAHLMLSVASEGEFVSLLDPPEWAREAAAGCAGVGLFPVLAGDAPERNLLLAAPIILYDHPRVAPESKGDLYDATEIDEILTLRTMTLTDEEKRQARATDPRIAAMLDRIDATTPATLDSLHGIVRPWNWDETARDDTVRDDTVSEEIPEASILGEASQEDLPDTLLVGDRQVGAGARVRLRPGARRTDAQDMFLVGQCAIVEKVMRDVEGRDCFAVLIEDDPASDLYRWHGRFLYFYPDELELIDALDAIEASATS